MEIERLIPEDFSQEKNPKKNFLRKNTMDTQNNDTNDMVKFFGKDLMSTLGQAPIKKTPKRSEARQKRQRETTTFTAEEEKEIKELFGENQNQVIYFD